MTDCICWYSQGLCTAHPSNAPRPTPPEPDEAERAEVARLRAQLAEAREVLRSVEWDSLRWDALTGREQGGYCVVCGGEDPRLDGTGHAADCLLAAVLENS